MDRKFVIILTLISIFTFSTGISLAIEPIDNELEKAELECKKLGFKSGAEMFKCKFQLFEVRKKIQIENGEIALAKQMAENEKRKAESAEAYAAQLEKYAASLENRAYQSQNRNSNALTKQGMNMITGRCTYWKGNC